MPPVVIAIEGNIGVGKSTVLNNLKAHFANDKRVAFCDEPVGLWEEHGLLAAMYSNTLSRCSFQLMALMTRYAVLQQALSTDAELIITERSIFSDRHCFAKVNLEAGSADSVAYDVSHAAMCSTLPGGLRHGTVLLAASRSTVVSRIAKRGRAAENNTGDDSADEGCGIPDAYLASLDDAHAAYFEMLDAPARARIDASATPTEVCAAVIAAIDALGRDAAGVDAAAEGMAGVDLTEDLTDGCPSTPTTPTVTSPTTVMSYETKEPAWRAKGPVASLHATEGTPDMVR